MQEFLGNSQPAETGLKTLKTKYYPQRGDVGECQER